MNELALPSSGGASGAPGVCLHGLSLCAGAGGIDLGLRLACPGYRTVCYVEREAYAAAILVARMEDQALDCAPLWDDVATFDGSPWRGAVDILTGGYPCQPFSVAGKRKGTADPRHLWPHFARIISECQPEWVFLENVANHLNLGYREVRGELEELGYRVTEGLFTAAEVGAPHKRQRLFILARRRACELADATRERKRKPADQANTLATGGQTRDESGDQGGDVADAADRQLSQPGRRPEAREGPGRDGTRLADTDGDRRQQTERRKSQDSRPDTRQPHVDDTNGARSQGRGDESGEYPGERPAWPPGPGDADGWKRYLRAAPDAEPSVCRGADGLAYRVDRLRLCGNGVVPLVAAHAFRILSARFIEDE